MYWSRDHLLTLKKSLMYIFDGKVDGKAGGKVGGKVDELFPTNPEILRGPRYFWRFWRWTHSWNSRKFDFTKTQRFVSAKIIDGRKL